MLAVVTLAAGCDRSSGYAVPDPYPPLNLKIDLSIDEAYEGAPDIHIPDFLRFAVAIFGPAGVEIGLGPRREESNLELRIITRGKTLGGVYSPERYLGPELMEEHTRFHHTGATIEGEIIGKARGETYRATFSGFEEVETSIPMQESTLEPRTGPFRYAIWSSTDFVPALSKVVAACAGVSETRLLLPAMYLPPDGGSHRYGRTGNRRWIVLAAERVAQVPDPEAADRIVAFYLTREHGKIVSPAFGKISEAATGPLISALSSSKTEIRIRAAEGLAWIREDVPPPVEGWMATRGFIR